MRKRSVQRWSAQPGSDLLETRTLLSTLVIVEHRHDIPPPPGAPTPGDGFRFQPPDGTMRGMPGVARPNGDEGGPGPRSVSRGTPGDAGFDSFASSFGALPPRPMFVRGFGFHAPTASGMKSGGETYSLAKVSSSGAASKLGSPDASNSVASQIQQAVISKGAGATDSFRSAGPQIEGPGGDSKREPIRHEDFRPFVGFASILSDPSPAPAASVTAPLAGTALPDDISVSNANPLSIPLSLYRINAPNNFLLPPPIASRDATGLIAVDRPAATTQEPAPLIVARGDRADAGMVSDPARDGGTDATIDRLALEAGGSIATPEAEPEALHLGIGLLTDWLLKDPSLGDSLSLSGSEAEDVLRDHSILSVAAVLGGLTAVEVGRRIVRRWMSEDSEVEAELDASWIDGELLREWSGRMSPRFS